MYRGWCVVVTWKLSRWNHIDNVVHIKRYRVGRYVGLISMSPQFLWRLIVWEWAWVSFLWLTHCRVGSYFVMYTLVLYSFVRKVWFYNEEYFHMIKLDKSCCFSNFSIHFLLFYRALYFMISSILKFFQTFL